MIAIVKTMTWCDVLDMLLGVTSILCFIIGVVFAFGV